LETILKTPACIGKKEKNAKAGSNSQEKNNMSKPHKSTLCDDEYMNSKTPKP